MVTNNYFQSGKGPGAKSEQDLAESNIVELIQLAGMDFYYIPRTIFNPDKFYQEVPNSKFEDYHVLEMYLTNVTDFGGQGDFMSKFGLQVNDTVDLVCSRKRFQEEVGIENPSEGDLIYLPLTRHLFEIDFVEDEPGNIANVQQFYSLSKLYTFCFKCSLYTYSYEDFDTGVAAIDNKLDDATFVPVFQKNTEINNEAKTALDFSESNPFGETVDRDSN